MAAVDRAAMDDGGVGDPRAGLRHEPWHVEWQLNVHKVGPRMICLVVEGAQREEGVRKGLDGSNIVGCV